MQAPVRPVVPWTWRRVLRDHGPPERDFLVVMLTLSTYMNRDGFTFVSQRTLARKARMDVKTLRKHLVRSERDGWLLIEKRRGEGQAWAQSLYRATCPENIELPAKDTALADSIVAEFGSVNSEAEGSRIPRLDKGEGTKFPSRSCANTMLGGEGRGNGHLDVGEFSPEGEGNFAKVGEHDFPTNSHLRSLITPVRVEGAQARPGRFSVKERGNSTEEERRDKILRLPDLEPGDVAKLLQTLGVTVDEVLRVRETAGCGR